MTDENKNVRMNALYPEHTAALEKAKLAPKKWPSLKQVMKKVCKSDEEKKQKKKDREKRQKKCYETASILLRRKQYLAKASS
jgi:hypothetical protein